MTQRYCKKCEEETTVGKAILDDHEYCIKCVENYYCPSDCDRASTYCDTHQHDSPIDDREPVKKEMLYCKKCNNETGVIVNCQYGHNFCSICNENYACPSSCYNRESDCSNHKNDPPIDDRKILKTTSQKEEKYCTTCNKTKIFLFNTVTGHWFCSFCHDDHNLYLDETKAEETKSEPQLAKVSLHKNIKDEREINSATANYCTACRTKNWIYLQEGVVLSKFKCSNCYVWNYFDEQLKKTVNIESKNYGSSSANYATFDIKVPKTPKKPLKEKLAPKVEKIKEKIKIIKPKIGKFGKKMWYRKPWSPNSDYAWIVFLSLAVIGCIYLMFVLPVGMLTLSEKTSFYAVFIIILIFGIIINSIVEIFRFGFRYPTKIFVAIGVSTLTIYSIIHLFYYIRSFL